MPHCRDGSEVQFLDENAFFVLGGFVQDLAVRSCDETLPPEFYAPVAGGVGLEARAVNRDDEAAVGDGVRTLHRFPCLVLRDAHLLLFLRVPADGRGVKEDFSALQRGQAGRFRVPLVPANQRAERGLVRGKRLESEVAGREVEFLVIPRIIGNVHLAVFAHVALRAVDDRNRIVVQTCRPSFKETRDHGNPVLCRKLFERIDAGARNRFGQLE